MTPSTHEFCMLPPMVLASEKKRWPKLTPEQARELVRRANEQAAREARERAKKERETREELDRLQREIKRRGPTTKRPATKRTTTVKPAAFWRERIAAHFGASPIPEWARAEFPDWTRR